jgi:hypothetical protein
VCAGGIAHSSDATALRLAVHMNGACAAQANAAAELCSSKPQEVAKIPQQRHLRIALVLPRHAIYSQLHD